MLHLYHFESPLEQHGNLLWLKIGPNMIGIQDGYNKNFHKSALNTMRSLMLDDCFEIWRW